MKKAIQIFFMILGVIFFIILLAIGGWFVFTSEETKTPVSLDGAVDVMSDKDVSVDGVDKHPALNESQEAVLETFGIDPAGLPTEMSADQQACFETEIGVDRVAEIKAGDTPTAAEIFKARNCI